MTSYIQYGLLTGKACLVLIVTTTTLAMAADSSPASMRQPTEARDFIIAPEMPFRASLRTTGIFINAHHLTRPTEKVIESLESQSDRPKVTVIICRGPQEQTIRTFWEVSDQFIIESLFFLPDWNPPPSDTLVWPGFDHPMINYLRKIRSATMGKPTIASVPMTCREVWGVPRQRPQLFDELRWMTMAVIGANYQGILWGHVRREKEWNQILDELTQKLMAHAADLGTATLVDWAQAPDGQPVSALASDGKLFVILLNTDYMDISADKRQIIGALNPGRRQGTVTLKLPPNIIAESASTLDGWPVELTQDIDSLKCAYDFDSGGEMIIVTINRNHQSHAGASESSGVSSRLSGRQLQPGKRGHHEDPPN